MYNYAVPYSCQVWSLVIVNIIATRCLKLMNTDSVFTISLSFCWNVDKFYLFMYCNHPVLYIKPSRNLTSSPWRRTVGNRWFTGYLGFCTLTPTRNTTPPESSFLLATDKPPAFVFL